MKRFTFVVALAGACVGMAMAQSPKVAKLENLSNVSVLKIDKEMPELQKKNVKALRPAEKFDFVKENQKRIMRKPAQVTAMTAPEALPATNVYDIGFVANWNEAEGANYYEVDVYRTYTTVEPSIYCALYEDFYFVEESAEEYTNWLDGYTYRYNWPLIGGKLGNQSIIFPKTSSQGVTELDTPSLDLTGGTSTVYLGISLEGNVGDKIYLGYIYVDEAGEEQIATLGNLPLSETTLNGTITLPDLPVSTSSAFALYTMGDNTGDLKLSSFMVMQEFEAGTQFVGFHDYYTTPGTSASFFTMEKDVETEGVTDEFMYGVFALDVNMETGEILENSEMSNVIVVGEESAVEGLTAGNDKIFVHDNLHVVLEKPATVDVYNMAGVRVMSVEGVEGDNEIALPASGAYIVKAGNTVAKVMK